MERLTEKNTYKIAFFCFFLLYYIVAFIPVLKSGYMYDDLYNYASKGLALSEGLNYWQLTKKAATQWFVQYGRAFIFAFYMFFSMPFSAD